MAPNTDPVTGSLDLPLDESPNHVFASGRPAAHVSLP
jgi:hypothetical protein